MFGHEDIIRGLDTRSTTVKCISAKGVLLVLSKEKFNQQIAKQENVSAYAYNSYENLYTQLKTGSRVHKRTANFKQT
jgi:hypothetical protein